MLLEAYVTLPNNAHRIDVERLFAGEKFSNVPQIELARSDAALTPAVNVAAEVRKQFPGFINTMINLPPADGAFTDELDIEQMERSMRQLGKYTDGFVVGMNTEGGRLNEFFAVRLYNAAKGKPLTYRIDDIAPEHQAEALKALAAIGYKSILTSGQPGGAGKFDNSAESVVALARKAKKYGIKTVARGGITEKHFEQAETLAQLAEIGGVHARFDDADSKKLFSCTTFNRILLNLEDSGIKAEMPRLPHDPWFGNVEQHPERQVRRKKRVMTPVRRTYG